MNEKQKQEWITPNLFEYGDVVKLTEIPVKVGGSGDAMAADQLDDWTSGCVH